MLGEVCRSGRQRGCGGAVTATVCTMAGCAVSRKQRPAAFQIRRARQRRIRAARPWPCGTAVHRCHRERHVRHVIVRAVARLACVRFALGPGELTRPSERLEVRHQIARLLTRTVRRPVEERSVGRHHRIEHDRARRVKMQVVPIGCARPGRSGEIGPDAPGAPEMRVVELRLPRKRRRAEPGDIGVEIADLLRVAVRAPFTSVDVAPATLADAEAEGHTGRHPARLIFEHAARPVAEQHDRHHEESDAGDAGYEVRHPKRASGTDAHAGSAVVDATRGMRRSAPPRSTASSRSVSICRRGPVVRPMSSAMKPLAIGTAECARITQ